MEAMPISRFCVHTSPKTRRTCFPGLTDGFAGSLGAFGLPCSDLNGLCFPLGSEYTFCTGQAVLWEWSGGLKSKGLVAPVGFGEGRKSRHAGTGSSLGIGSFTLCSRFSSERPSVTCWPLHEVPSAGGWEDGPLLKRSLQRQGYSSRVDLSWASDVGNAVPSLLLQLVGSGDSRAVLPTCKEQ